jgi:hypothetical protein
MKISTVIVVFLAVFVLLSLPKLSLAQPSDETIKCLQWFRYVRFDTSEATQSLSGTKGLLNVIPGCNYVHIECIMFVSSNTVRTSFVSQAEYASAISKAHKAGYKVIFRIAIQPSMEYTPTSPAAFFSSYTGLVKSWGQFCQQNGVESICIGVEMTQLEVAAYNVYWSTMISELRKVYFGKVWYETNNWYLLSGTLDSLQQKLSLTWFSKLDYIGVSAYFKMTTRNLPTVAELKTNWHSYVGGGMPRADIVAQIEQISTRFGKKILVVSGLSSALGACQAPWKWTWKTQSLVEQTNWYEALFQTFVNKSWVAGFSFDNSWQTRYNANFPIAFSVQNKPAASVIRNWFSRM